MTLNPPFLCRCGHSMLLHDVEDMDGSDPMCCVEGCDQVGCGRPKFARNPDEVECCDPGPYCDELPGCVIEREFARKFARITNESGT